MKAIMMIKYIRRLFVFYREVNFLNKRLDYFLEISQFPLIILFTGCVLIGLGNLIVNPYIEHLWNTNGQLINLISLYSQCMFALEIKRSETEHSQ